MELPEFKLIVAGGRDFNDYPRMEKQLFQIAESNPTFTTRAISIVSGMARGADALAVRFAHENHVQLYEFPADWDTYGKRAGFMRNDQMAQFSDGLLAYWDGQSRGTKHMIDTMTRLGKLVYVEFY